MKRLHGLQKVAILILSEDIEVFEVRYLLSFLRQVKLGALPNQVEGQARGLGGWREKRMDGALIHYDGRFV